jgi:hypothetical protein
MLWQYTEIFYTSKSGYFLESFEAALMIQNKVISMKYQPKTVMSVDVPVLEYKHKYR